MSQAKKTARSGREQEYSQEPDTCQPGFRPLVDGWLNIIQRTLSPPTCVLCGDSGDIPGIDLCAPCAAELPRNAVACAVCAQPLSGCRSGLICGRCQQRPPRYHASFCPYVYAYPIDHLVRGLKYHGALAQGRVLGELLARALEAQPPSSMPDCLVPVPLGTRRYRVRGYNQAVELALPIQERCGIALRTDLVERTRETREQTALDQLARRKNLRGAFTVLGKPRLRHVAIVDDVITTGSTVNELARVLRRAGVERVEVWAIARAGR